MEPVCVVVIPLGVRDVGCDKPVSVTMMGVVDGGAVVVVLPLVVSGVVITVASSVVDILSTVVVSGTVVVRMIVVVSAGTVVVATGTVVVPTGTVVVLTVIVVVSSLIVVVPSIIVVVSSVDGRVDGSEVTLGVWGPSVVVSDAFAVVDNCAVTGAVTSIIVVFCSMVKVTSISGVEAVVEINDVAGLSAVGLCPCVILPTSGVVDVTDSVAVLGRVVASNETVVISCIVSLSVVASSEVPF